MVKPLKSIPKYINPTLGPFFVSQASTSSSHAPEILCPLDPIQWDTACDGKHLFHHGLGGPCNVLQQQKTQNTRDWRKEHNCFMLMLTYCYQAGHLDSSNPPAPGSLWVVSIQRSSPLTARTVQASSKPRPDGGNKAFDSPQHGGPSFHVWYW